MDLLVNNDDRYQNLTQLLTGGKSVSDFGLVKDIEDRDWLLDKGFLIEKETIEPDLNKISLLYQLYEHNYICLQYFKSEELNKWIKDKKLRVTGTLLSEPEAEYLNFLLNKREFSNGLDLRNKYIHDSIPQNEERQQQDYVILMKVMIILIIKINEEFCLRKTDK